MFSPNESQVASARRPIAARSALPVHYSRRNKSAVSPLLFGAVVLAASLAPQAARAGCIVVYLHGETKGVPSSVERLKQDYWESSKVYSGKTNLLETVKFNTGCDERLYLYDGSQPYWLSATVVSVQMALASSGKPNDLAAFAKNELVMVGHGTGALVALELLKNPVLLKHVRRVISIAGPLTGSYLADGRFSTDANRRKLTQQWSPIPWGHGTYGQTSLNLHGAWMSGDVSTHNVPLYTIASNSAEGRFNFALRAYRTTREKVGANDGDGHATFASQRAEASHPTLKGAYWNGDLSLTTAGKTTSANAFFGRQKAFGLLAKPDSTVELNGTGCKASYGCRVFSPPLIFGAQRFRWDGNQFESSKNGFLAETEGPGVCNWALTETIGRSTAAKLLYYATNDPALSSKLKTHAMRMSGLLTAFVQPPVLYPTRAGLQDTPAYFVWNHATRRLHLWSRHSTVASAEVQRRYEVACFERHSDTKPMLLIPHAYRSSRTLRSGEWVYLGDVQTLVPPEVCELRVLGDQSTYSSRVAVHAPPTKTRNWVIDRVTKTIKLYADSDHAIRRREIGILRALGFSRLAGTTAASVSLAAALDLRRSDRSQRYHC